MNEKSETGRSTCKSNNTYFSSVFMNLRSGVCLVTKTDEPAHFS